MCGQNADVFDDAASVRVRRVNTFWTLVASLLRYEHQLQVGGVCDILTDRLQYFGFKRT